MRSEINPPNPIAFQWQRVGLFAGSLVILLLAFVGVSFLEPPAIPTVSPMPIVETTTTTLPPSPVPRSTTIAKVAGPLPYSAAPGGEVVGALPVGKWWGTTKFLPVIARVPGWLQVRLPQRPNGSTGWISESSAELSVTPFAILIDVNSFRLKLYQAGEVVLDFPAGVGTVDDPTPLGDFYVMVIEDSPGPGYGPFLIGTNAHSEAIQSWQGSGDAFTAIHGPVGADAAIGTTGGQISHGCVRLHIADLKQLDGVPPGAPVVIAE